MPPEEIQTAALEVLISQVGDMREDIREMRSDLKSLTETKVSYREWSQRNTEVNGRFATLGREVADLRMEHRSDVANVRAAIAAKSAPWWSVGSLVVAAAALAWAIFTP